MATGGEAAHGPPENVPQLVPIQQPLNEQANLDFPDDPEGELLQALLMEVDLPPIPDLPEQVIAMDDLSDSSEEMPPLIDDNEEEVDMPVLQNLHNHGLANIEAPLALPLDNNLVFQPPVLNVLEVPIAELVPFEELAPNQNQNPLLGPADIQLGMVHTFFNIPDPRQHLNCSFMDLLCTQQPIAKSGIFHLPLEQPLQSGCLHTSEELLGSVGPLS